MAWDTYQRYRLAMEKEIVEKDFSHFTFYNPAIDTFLQGVWSSSKDNQFVIRIQLPSGFPEECPSTYVTYPTPLWGRYKSIESYGSSHAMHCWQTDKPGWSKICTFQPQFWSAEYSLAMVALKAQLWLEALESHRETGRDIAEFLLTWDQT